MHDRLTDRWLGVDTESFLMETPTGTAHDDGNPYESPAWKHVHLILRRLSLQPDDHLVDYGCGAGRILCAAGRMRLGHLTGVECSGKIADLARRNLERVRGRGVPFDVYEADAVSFEPRGCSVAFYFNPFGPATLAETLRKLQSEANRARRPIKIAYLHPKHREVIDQLPSAVLRERLKWRRFRHEVLVYDLNPET